MGVKKIIERLFVEFPGGEILGILIGLASLLLFLYIHYPIFVAISSISFFLAFTIGISIFLIYPVFFNKPYAFLVNHFIYSLAGFILYFSLYSILIPQKGFNYVLNSTSEYFVIATFFFMIYTFLGNVLKNEENENKEKIKILKNLKKNLRKTTILSSCLLYFAGFTHLWFKTFESSEKFLILLTNFLVILSIVQVMGVVATLLALEYFHKKR